MSRLQKMTISELRIIVQGLKDQKERSLTSAKSEAADIHKDKSSILSFGMTMTASTKAANHAACNYSTRPPLSARIFNISVLDLQLQMLAGIEPRRIRLRRSLRASWFFC